MASGKYSRSDSRTSSSFCSATTITVLIAVCLVGVWMIASSTKSREEVLSLDTESDTSDETSPASFKYTSSARTEHSVNEDPTKGYDNENNPNSSDGSDGEDNKDSGTTEETKDAEKVDSTSDETGGHENDGVENNDESNENKIGSQTNEIEEEVDQSSKEGKEENQLKDKGENEIFPLGTQSELLNETNSENGAWSTQAVESKNEKDVQASSSKGQNVELSWKLCDVKAGTDYIPCLDNEAAIGKLRSTKHYEHRERHCPDNAPTCLVPLPDGYKPPIKWPMSREKIWYNNVPRTKLATVKGHQNWVKVSGEYLTFPGGGTQFKHGALHYIDFIQESWPDIAWGKRTRVILDVGCGVASFGGYNFDRDVLTMSLAPKDEHEAQVQFALERGIPAISAVMGTQRLPFPSKVFDVVHCARCRVPWHIEGGKLLLELNRLLRPGGYFVWSATPVYQNHPEDVEIWKAMSSLTKSMCWQMVTRRNDTVNQVGLAIFRKPSDNKCYEKRAKDNPPICQETDNPDAAWYVPLQACIHKLPVNPSSRGTTWPEHWPQRLEKTPYWLDSSQLGVYGKPAPEDYETDYDRWKHVVTKSYSNGMGIDWSTIRNVMDMRSVYGGFAAALRDMNVWVMNVVPIDLPDTLPIIYERGLFGMYHDWCESFSTYPRTYDLLHADHLFSKLKKRCSLLSIITEVDRILRPKGKLIVRDKADTIDQIGSMVKSLKWDIILSYSKDKEGLLCVQKSMWRPKEVETSMSL
ncbi:probable methyltransferase PMT26 [Zingiber officinale]|uniref:probable methyltransferase PMT26 n=1 Tax=Zingiber officinale TaxID=94328 RepID=UPI001C4D6614|nr:probable methyltransferase PMT26 [Zingiber officinale]XP_042416813.1 probable methyltransferase PMT26 [Zingiber officinale]